MKVIVRTAHQESELEAVPKTAGRDIFRTMCKSLGIQEVWWFGLMYKGPDNEEIWVDKSKKTLKDLQKHINNLQFKVKYYPEDVSEELIETVTIEYFFLQVKAQVIRDEIFCPADTCVLLASYALQAKHGEYSDHQQNGDLFKKQQMIPERIIKQHSMSVDEWNKSIVNMWTKHRGMDREDAMLEYLKLVQNLEMYGVAYYNISNKKGSKLLLGITSLGMNIYKVEDRLNPTISFPWSEIKNLKYKGTKFIIKPTDKAAKDFIIFTQNERISKHVLMIGIGNHELYVRRRKPDTPDVVKMKERAQEVRKTKMQIREKYKSERIAREEAEKRETLYKQQIDDILKEMAQQKNTLIEAQETIRRLQEQLEALQRSKEELEQQRSELQNMMERLEQNKNMETNEKAKLEEEIRAKQDEVRRIHEEVEKKNEETRLLQEQVDAARQKEEELRQQRIEEAARWEEERQRLLKEEESLEKGERELEELPKDADTALPELQEVNEQLKEQLKQLQSQLDVTTKKEEETSFDRIHRANLLEGRDKYKTLADIRRGNTSRRVEMFENM